MSNVKFSARVFIPVLVTTLVILLTGCSGSSTGGSSSGNNGGYTISGTMSGLNGTVALQNNGGSTLNVSSNGTFTFIEPVSANGVYSVLITSQPAGQTCTVSSGSGSGVMQNISSVAVLCSATAYSIGGSVSGLSAGEKITLKNNNADPLTLTSDGTFTFNTAIAYGANYSVTIGAQPTGQTCSVSSSTGSGTSVVSSVTNVGITCTPFTESVIYQFATGSGGENPRAGLILGSDGKFYGAAYEGGTGGAGTIFNVTSAGAETALYTFDPISNLTYPGAGIVQGTDGNFYGTTYVGGTYAWGVVYQITSSGVATILYSFTGLSDGGFPATSLIQGSDGNFYGTTLNGGSVGVGTVFKVTSSGIETVLYSFAGGTDGSNPQAGLIQGLDGNFYGTTSSGGGAGFGTVFRVTPAGVETVLYSFAGGTDGANPTAALVQSTDGNFYGTTYNGGTGGNNGTVFKITPAGAETVLHSFAGGTDGAFPFAALIQATDGNFYGTTYEGGTSDFGTIVKITPDGVETVLHSFAGGSDGAYPYSPLILYSDGHFYGTTKGGDVSTDYGTVFRY